MIAFSIDIDWAHDEVIKDTLALFEAYGVKCTIFSTHHTKVIAKCNRKLFEVAVHPNFNALLEGSDKRYEDIIDEIIDAHPDAKGVRSHSLMQSTQILQKFADKGFVYDANLLLPYHTALKPFMSWNGMVRIPYNWEDDVHWSYGYLFDRSRMTLDSGSLVIFDFHPIHIFLNTENKFRYNKAKTFAQDPDKLIKYKNSEIKGARDLLISLLDYCKQNKIKTFKHIEIAEDFLKQNQRT